MGQDKLWCDVGGRPLLALTLDAVAAAARFDIVVVATPPARWQEIEVMAVERGLPTPRFVEGGERRQDSVRNALAESASAEWVCVHDAARPLVSPELMRRVLEAAAVTGAATAGVPSVDTIKMIEDGHVVRTLDRSSLVATQTPQAFRTAVLVEAHERARIEGVAADDDAFLVERIGVRVAVVPGERRNLKVTHPDDLELVRALHRATA